jgi:hypothetical protein
MLPTDSAVTEALRSACAALELTENEENWIRIDDSIQRLENAIGKSKISGETLTALKLKLKNGLIRSVYKG